MTDLTDPTRPSLPRLGLRVAFPPDGRDAPELAISVDGIDLAELPGAPSDFRGFPVDQVLPPPPVELEDEGWHEGDPVDSPLLQDRGRRIALYTCSCGIAGCGVIAPVIATDGDIVTWSDFRDLTGVFDLPDDPSPEVETGALGMGQWAFDRTQYEAEVARVAADRSWESPSRLTARILKAMLREHEDRIGEAGFRLGWVASAFWSDSVGQVELSLEPLTGRSSFVVGIGAKFGTPFSRARSMQDRLLEHPVSDWYRRFPAGR